MYERDLFNHKALALQIQRQKKYAWDLEKDINWKRGVDPTRFLLPLDKDNILFPGADAKQQLAISQILGLVFNAAIADLEVLIGHLKNFALTQVLRSYPVGPEMMELGQLFFEEERKHSQAFQRYVNIFSETLGIRNEALYQILPTSYGSSFLNAITDNCKAGGHSFWWMTAIVEEISLELYKEIQKHKENIDPLFFEIHFKHMEEESRHHNFPFLMLDVISRRRSSPFRSFHKKTDLIFGQVCFTAWCCGELAKVLEAKRFASEHPFFETLASCEPLFKNMSWLEVAKRMFISSPYISMTLNTRNHKQTCWLASKQKALNFPFPKPQHLETFSTPHNIRTMPKGKKKKKNAGPNSRKRAS